jgi:anti-sigma factor RsiW
MTCSEIEKLLPACLDDLLPQKEREGVEEHLASCAACRLDLTRLRKAREIVQDLGEVDPPPFFEQRIMSRIREEAVKKPGILRKFFYPLQIKIPIQALAAVCIVVLALQVYRAGEPEMKGVANLSLPMAESEKGRIEAESPPVPKAAAIPQAPAASLPGTPAARGPVGGLPEKDRQRIASPPAERGGKADRMADTPKPTGEGFAPAVKSGIPALAERKGTAPSAVKSEAPAMAAREGETPAVTGAVGRPRETAASRETDTIPEAPLTKGQRGEREVGAVADRAKMAAVPAPSRETAREAIREPDIDWSIRAGDPAAAVGEIEEALGGFGGRVITRRHSGGGEILMVEITTERVAPFLDRLAAVGEVHAKKPSRAAREGKTTLRITVVRNR